MASVAAGSGSFASQPLLSDLLTDVCLLDTIKQTITAEWPFILMLVVICGSVYYWLVLPMNWVKDCTDVGFDDALREQKLRNRDKTILVREILERKNFGQIPPVYPNGWFAVLESDALAPGEVKYVSALGENFAIFRSKAGEAFILDAYCPHLGANMAIGGTVHGDCLECPFHGWRFRGHDGKCISISYSDKVPDSALAKKWTSDEVNSYIFVWFHAEKEEPTWRIQPVSEVVTGSWIYRGRNQFTVNCHIQDIPENGCDIAHLDAIHGMSMFTGSRCLSSPDNLFTWLLATIFSHSWTAKWERSADCAHIANAHLHHDLKVLNKISLMSNDVTVHQIGPSYVELVMHSRFGSMIILQTVLPEGPLRQRVIHRIYCPLHMAIYASFALVGESIMFQRDMMVWNHKTYLPKPFLVKGDGKIMQFRRWFSQFYSENSERFTFRKQTLEW